MYSLLHVNILVNTIYGSFRAYTYENNVITLVNLSLNLSLNCANN